MLKFAVLYFHCYVAADGKSVGWDLFSYIKKNSNYPLHPQKCWILSKIGRNESFFWAQHCWEEWEDEGMNPELMKKIVIRSLWNSHLKRFFAVSGVLLTSIFITGQLTISTHLIKQVEFVVYVPISTLSSTMSLYVTPTSDHFLKGVQVKKAPIDCTILELHWNKSSYTCSVQGETHSLIAWLRVKHFIHLAFLSPLVS